MSGAASEPGLSVFVSDATHKLGAHNQTNQLHCFSLMWCSSDTSIHSRNPNSQLFLPQWHFQWLFNTLVPQESAFNSTAFCVGKLQRANLWFKWPWNYYKKFIKLITFAIIPFQCTLPKRVYCNHDFCYFYWQSCFLIWCLVHGNQKSPRCFSYDVDSPQKACVN